MLGNLVNYDQHDFVLDASYLWVWNPTGVPPHMGLSTRGSYFSLKASGLDFDSDLQDIIGIIVRKKLAVIAIRLKQDLDIEECKSVFEKYERTIAHEITCLNPIKTVLDYQAPRKLSELLEELDARQLIGEKTVWSIDKSSIELADYSTEDIHKYLLELTK